jgi:glyoxylate/hydroxypyruvate reductase A
LNAILLAMTGMEPETWVARLKALDPDRDVRAWPEVGNPQEIAYAMAWKPEPGALDGLSNLKAVFSLGAGVDALLAIDGLPDVPLVRVVDPDLTMRMSEYVVLNVLLHHRHMLRALDDQRARRWEPRDQPAASSVRVGILGLGELGLDAARKLTMMGFQVAGWSRSAKQRHGIATYFGEVGLKQMLGRTDILVVLLPLTPATTGIIDTVLLRGLARDGALGGPVLINAGRGGLQNEADVLAALDDGTLLAASLDVFVTEPLPESSPFWTHPKVIVTPHVGADSDPEALARYLMGQVHRFEAGEGLTNVVDRTAGY